MKTVFELKVFTFADFEAGYEDDDSFGINYRERIFIPSLEEAEALMKRPDFVRTDIRDTIYRFYLREYPMMQVLYRGDILSERVYDPNGELIDQTLCSSCFEDIHTPAGRYMGRRANQIRFQPGEIVECFDGEDTVRLGIVVGTPYDTERCQQIMQRILRDPHFAHLEDKSQGYILDFTDDTYTVVDTPEYMESHEHIPSNYVFAPSFPVPEKVEKRLLEAYRKITEKD